MPRLKYTITTTVSFEELKYSHKACSFEDLAREHLKKKIGSVLAPIVDKAKLTDKLYNGGRIYSMSIYVEGEDNK